MFSKKKNKDVDATSTAAVETPAAPVKVKKKKGGMFSIFKESVMETVMTDFKENDQFIHKENGEDKYVGIMLDTKDIGGLDKKSKKVEAKGQLIECINSGRIKTVITQDLMDEECIVFIPEAFTLNAMDEFSLLTDAKYELCYVYPDGDVECLGKKVTYSEITDILTADGGHIDDILGSDNDVPDVDLEPDALLDDDNTSAETEAEIKFGYCTEFIIVLNAPMSDNEEHAYKAFLESIGDSIVVVADDEIVKTHVHTNDPGLALQKALTFGSLSKIKIDNMREEHQEKLIKDSQKLAAQQKAEEEAYEAAQADEKTNNMPAKEMGFVSVSIGEGMNEVFRGLGVDYLIEGGQTMNPSTEDMLNAIEHVNAKTVFILPNNKNIIMAANQAVDLVEDKQIIVIPTKTIPQGITALVNYIPDHSAEENKEQMMAEIENVKTGQVTYAVRDTEIDGKTIKQNDFMGIGDKSILSVGTDLRATTLEMVDAMVDEDSAIVSIYFGSDSDEDSANELAAAIEEKYPDVEVEVNDGGQPIYYYVISVE